MDASVLIGLIIGLITLGLSLIGMVSGGVWIVATVKATVSQLVEAFKGLAASVDRLTGRIDELEHDHADTRERVAKLEGESER